MNSTTFRGSSEQMHRLIKLAEVKALTTLSTSEIYRRIAAGTFPPQVKLGPKSVAWPQAAIDAWCDFQITASQREAS
jgi:prophage regulatory protein